MDMEKLVALCRRKGFIFGSSEIYGGINGFWDYGPLGVELKNNIKAAWWHDMVRCPPLGPDGQEIQMVGVDCSIIMNPKVWEASGHVGGFSDPMVDCLKCRKRFRADKVFITEFSGNAKLNDIGQSYGIISFEADTLADASPLAEKHVAKLEKKLKRPQGSISRRTWPATQNPVGKKMPCPSEGCDGELTEARSFNLMFKTHVGAVEEESTVA